MPNTPLGIPYPPASDPVAQGAAAMQALAAKVDELIAPSRKLSLALRASVSNAAFTYITFDAAGLIDELGGFALGTRAWFQAPVAGDYLATFLAIQTGATGGSTPRCAVDHYSAGAAGKLATILDSYAGMNEAANGAGIARMAVNERLYWGVMNPATGTAGTLACRATVTRVG